MTRAPHARRARATAPVLGLLACLVLAGCSGSDDTSSAPDADGSPARTATPASGYLPVPDEVSLTEPGSELDHGQSATVAWELPGGEVGVLDLSVERVREVRPSVFAGWLQEDATSSARPYFVHATVQNRGSRDLGGEVVPLYLLAGETLVPRSRFGGTFKPCPSRPLPRRFLEGDETKLCLVYLAPRRGRIEAMSFDPVEGFDAITWRGKVSRPPGAGDDPAKKSKGKDQKGPKGQKDRSRG